MEVKLVSITKPMVEEAPDMTAEELIVYTARVSNPSNQLNTSTADKLLGFLIRNKHWSPFEQADFGVKVVTSRAIAAQILRHWSISVQEFSQRYAEVVELEPVQLRYQAQTNRQSSTDSLNEHDERYFKFRMAFIFEQSEALYKDMISQKIAKECARMVLPLTSQTTMYLKGNVRDWIHYLSQRTDHHAQLEHRQIAWEIEDLFKQYYPNVFAAVEANKYEPELLKEFYEFLENDSLPVENLIKSTAVSNFIAHKKQQNARR